MNENDRKKAEAILETLAADTDRVFKALSDGLLSDADFKTIERSVTRERLVNALEQVRRETLQEAANAARRFSERTANAGSALSEAHEKRMVALVADLFDLFAKKLDPASELPVGPKAESRDPTPVAPAPALPARKEMETAATPASIGTVRDRLFRTQGGAD